MKTIYAVWLKSRAGNSRVEAFTLEVDAACYADMLARAYCDWFAGSSYEVVSEER